MPISAPISVIAKLFGKDDLAAISDHIYGTIVAQARNSALYTDFSIEDTVMGRYNMLALHVFLLTNWLKHISMKESNKCCVLSQRIFDLFVADIERGLRQIGFSDTSVFKRKKRLVRSYYALIDEFDRALDTNDIVALGKVVHKRYFDRGKESIYVLSATKLTDYMLRVAHSFLSQCSQSLMQGEIEWPSIVRK